MEQFEILLSSFQLILVIFIRVAGLLFTSPIFSTRFFLNRYKIFFSLWFAFAISPWAMKNIQIAPDNILDFFLLLGKELIVGMSIGFFVSLLFSCLRVGTDFFALQIGLGFSQVFDPMLGREVSILNDFIYMTCVLMFIAIGGMHLMIRLFIDSYVKLPIVDFLPITTNFFNISLKYFSAMFVIAIKFVLPVLLISILIYIVMGIISRISPQMNVLELSLPLQYILSFLVLFLIFPYGLDIFRSVMLKVFSEILPLLKER